MTAVAAALASTAMGIAGALLLADAQPVLGLPLLAASVVLLHWPQSLWTAAAPAELPARQRRWLLLAVTGIAAFFRSYRLEPPGLWGDDAVNGLLAFDILDGTVRSPFEIVVHSFSYFHALPNYFIAGAFWLFGADPWTLRLPSVLLGIAGAPLLYGIAAPLFGARVGLLAALFYACSPPQISHAKQLVQIISGEFFLLAGLCLLVQGTARARWAVTAAAGLPLALCAYTYHSARITPPIAIAYLGALAWAGRHPASRTSTAGGTGRVALRWSSGLALAIVFAVALVPAARGYLADPHALIGRVSSESIWAVMRERDSWAPLWDAAWRTLAMFHYQQGPEFHWFGIGTDPAFNAVVGFLCVHGVLASLLGWRQPRHVLLLAWVVVGLIPGVLSGGAPRLYRALYATLPLYVWAALPLERMLAAAAAAPARRALRWLALALVGLVPLIDFHLYFYRLYSHPAFHWFQGERIVEMARTLRGYGPGWTGYVLADDFVAEHEILAFLARAWGVQLRGVGSLAEVLPLPSAPERGALFMMAGAALPAADAVRAFYPAAELSQRREPVLRSWALDAYWPIAEPYGAPRAVLGFAAVPRAALEQRQRDPDIGLLGEYDLGDRRRIRHEPYPLFAFMPPTFPAHFRSALRGRLIVPEPGGYHLVVDSNAPWKAWLDGQRTDLSKPLAAGSHDFAVEIDEVSQTLQLQIFWHREGEERHLVPPEAWRLPPDGGTDAEVGPPEPPASAPSG